MTEVAALMGGLAVLISSIGSVVVGILSLRVQRTTKQAVEEVHVATNSMKDQLVAATALAAEAKGRDAERANPTGRGSTA